MLPAGLLGSGALAAGGEGGLAEGPSLWDLSPPSALPGLSGRGWGLLPGAGLQWGPEPVRNLSGARREGALLAQRTQARRKITYQAALSMLV